MNTKLPDFKFRPLEGCEIPELKKNGLLDELVFVNRKDFYESLDRQEEALGDAIKSTLCKHCQKPMTVKSYRPNGDTWETKWVCECGHTFTEIKNK